MKLIKLLVLGIPLLFADCSNKKSFDQSIDLSDCTVTHVKITLDEDYYTSVTQHIQDTSFVILHENATTMFTDADKIITFHDKYYIVDQSASRTVVSFNKDGHPMTRYGQVGQAPGEYVFPWDMDVDETGVYILDTNSKKVIHYTEDGRLVNEQRIPFHADACKRLKNGGFLFNLTPDGTRMPSLVYTDSLMHIVRQVLPYQEGYVGGYSTSDIFRKGGSEISFYRSPSDTLMVLDEMGAIQAVVVFDFQDKKIPEKAKTDYMAFRRNGTADDYLKWVNTPIAVNDSLWIGLVENENSQFTLVFNPLTHQCGSRKFTASSSVYDMIEPMFADGTGAIVSLVCGELEDRCRDYLSLPDSVRQAMEAGNRVLMINRFP